MSHDQITAILDIIINSTDWFLTGTAICCNDTENVESIPGVVSVEDDEVICVDDGVQNYNGVRIALTP